MDGMSGRLREERERLGLTQAEIGDLAQVTKNTQRLYESGRRVPKADYLEALDKAGLDIQYVVTGRRTIPPSGGADGSTEGASSTDTLIAVPIYDISAGTGDGLSLSSETVATTFQISRTDLAGQQIDPEHVAGVLVCDDSMEPTLFQGDWALVDMSQRPARPNGVYVYRHAGELHLKRLQRVAGGAWWVISDNERYERELIPPEEMGNAEILGQVVRRLGQVS